MYHWKASGWQMLGECAKGQGLLRKEGPPNIRYFVVKRSIVAIYALFEMLSWSFQQKSSFFGELSMKVSLLSESFRRAVQPKTNFYAICLCCENLQRHERTEGFCCVLRKPADPFPGCKAFDFILNQKQKGN